MINKKALFIINLGTPDEPNKRKVRKFLSEFLNDNRVIDMPWLPQKLLVNGIIVPFRTSKSTKLYQQLWSNNSSPLLYYHQSLAKKLQQRLQGEYTVFGVMRYGNPSLEKALNDIEKQRFDEIVFLPLFPQYASSTTGSTAEKIFNSIKKWNTIPTIKFIHQFYNHPTFIEALSKLISAYDYLNYDHILFTYHGLPNKHVQHSHPDILFENCTCENAMPPHGKLCYKATCYNTTRLLVEKLKIRPNSYSTCFQSRFAKNWLSPFTDEKIIELAQNGKNNILVIAPSFVADCLETTIEIEDEYKKLFIKNGGKKLTYVKSLNDSDQWVDAIQKIIQ